MNTYFSDKWSLSAEEKKALRALARLESIWPDSLSLQAGTGGLVVLKNDEEGQPHFNGQGLDQDYVVAKANIQADGGDPW